LFNIKWGIIAGAAALLLSLTLGIFNGVNFIFVLLRAGIFTAVFFSLGLGCSFLVKNYFPELLLGDAATGSRSGKSPGSRVNITLGGGALPEMYSHTDSSDDVGDIAKLVFGESEPDTAPAPDALYAMDQTAKDAYTNRSDVASAEFNQDNSGAGSDGVEVPESAPDKPAPAASTGDELGSLPDLDAMSKAFLIDADEDAPAEPEALESSKFERPKPGRSSGGGKTRQFEDDFSPKELASGIRTVLEKDKRG
jgi:hypothetical protein